MEFLRRNINKQSRNGDIISSSISSSYIGGGTNNSGGGVSGNYLPATKNDENIYIVPHYVTFQETTTTTDIDGNETETIKNLLEITSNGIIVNGDIIATGEVAAYSSGLTNGGTSGGGSVTVYDGLDSNAIDVALSANQGKVLNNKITDLSNQINGASTTLSALTDTNISNVSNGQILVYDGTTTKWINKTFDLESSAVTKHIADTTKHITADERTKWNKASDSAHSHSNIGVLSGITSTKVSNWDKASTSAHSHSNKTVIDGITSDLINKWNSAYTHISDSVTHVTESDKTKWNNKLDKSIWDSAFYFDSSNNLRVKINLIGEKEVSAYGSGSSSSSGAITIVDNLTSTLQDAALSANQGRVLKNLIDNIDVGNLDLSDYSRTGHTHTIANITNLQTALDGKSPTSHTHTQYASSSHTHAISAVTNLQTALDGKSGTGHTHSTYSVTSHTHPQYASSSHTHNYASIVKVGSTSYNISGNTISLPSYPTLSSLSGVSTSTFNTHSGNTTLHITATERTNWNKAYTNNHTHSNKSVLDGITSTKVSNWDTVYSNWNKAFSFDSNGNLKVSVNVIGEGEISAYGSGTSSSSGAITIVDNLTSTLTDAALSANQGRVLKNLIDNIDVGNLDLSDYSRTGHTHTIANITNLQSTLDGKSGTGHTHSNYSPTSHTHSNYSLTSHTHSTYYDSAVSRTKNTVLAAPNGSAGSATFRALVAADIPSLAISKITNLQSTLDGKSSTSHTHSNYSLTSHTHSDYATTGHTHSSLTFSGGTFSAKTYNPSGATTVNIPTSTSHLTNNSGFITSAATVAAANKVTSTLTFSGGTFTANTYNGSAAKTIYIPTNTTHLTNGSGYITSAATVAAANKVTSTLTFTTGTTSTGSYNGSSAVTIKIPSNTTHLTNGSGFITSAATVANSNKFSGYTMRSAATWVNNSVEAYIQYTIDATSLSTSNFYPIIFPTTQKDLYVRMYSTAGSASAAYNQNKLEFTFRGQGWNDTPQGLTVHFYNCYSSSETTIGCIGMGQEGGVKCIWVRGGLTYYVVSNITPTLKTANYTNGNEIFTTGTTLHGGTNTKVTVYWTPQSTSGLGTLYHSGGLALGGGLSINGAASLKSTLSVTDTSNFTGAATFNGGLTSTTLTARALTLNNLYTASLSSAGWYRFATSTTANNSGGTAIFFIRRNYYNSNNESWIIAVNYNFGEVTWKQLCGSAKTQLITNVRCTYTNNSTMYFDLYYSGTVANNVYVNCIGTATCQTPTATTSTLTTTSSFAPKQYAIGDNMAFIRGRSDNPLLCLTHTYNSTEYVNYVQAYQGQLMMGAGSSKSLKIDASGNVTAVGEVTAYSDKRLKKNIKSLEVRGELNPVSFEKDGKKSIGFIAQEVQELYPELVHTDEGTEEKYLSLNYAQLTAVLYAEIKELKERLSKLENE